MKIISIFFLLTLCNAANAQERLVKVNGNNYHILLKGFENRKSNTPAIIFENGIGSDLHDWNKVTDQISAFAPVLFYDRAGIGTSDKLFKMPTVESVNQNLHAMLAELKISPPYILVGHSFGGVYIRAFAGRYPNEIAGLVFIDPADFTETKNDWNNIFRTLGLPEKKIDEMLTERLYKPAKVDSVNYGPWSEIQVLNELRRNDFAEISALPMPKVPVYFFVGGKFEVPPERRSKEFDQERFFHIKNNSNMERWKKLIYASGKPGALIYLTQAGHYIQRDAPESVISNIRVLFEGVR